MLPNLFDTISVDEADATLITRAPFSFDPGPITGAAPSPDVAAAAPASPPSYRIAVYGHEREAAGLVRAIVAGSMAQTYLFAGPPGVGKRTLARFVAQAIVCTGDGKAAGVVGSAGSATQALAPARPCGACRACRLVAAGGHPDVQLVIPPLRIESVRQLQRELVLAPTESERRVVILPDMEDASPSAANSMLKMLEEPPRMAVLLLTTAELRDVLPTVRSRCQTLTLHAMPAARLADLLATAWGVPAERAELLARLAGGRLGWAVRAWQDEAPLASRQVWLDGLAQALATPRLARFELAGALAKLGDELAAGLAVWTSWWRDVLYVHHRLAPAVVNRDRLDELQAAAARFNVGQVVASLNALERALRHLAANANPQLALEVLFLDLP